MHYYMNNPCKIVREINEDLVEIVVCVNFADGLEGSGWCEACQINSYLTHTCEEYDDVIEQVMEETHEVPCIVERRLLSTEMVEVAHYCSIQKQLLEKKEQYQEWNEAVKSKQKRARELDGVVNGSLSLRDELTRQVSELTKQIAELKQES